MRRCKNRASPTKHLLSDVMAQKGEWATKKKEEQDQKRQRQSHVAVMKQNPQVEPAPVDSAWDTIENEITSESQNAMFAMQVERR
jgi:hypothetical protein